MPSDQEMQLFYQRHQLLSICFASLATCVVLEGILPASLHSDILTGMTMGLVMITVIVSLMAFISTNDIRKILRCEGLSITDESDKKMNDPLIMSQTKYDNFKAMCYGSIIMMSGLLFSVAGGVVFTASFISKSSALTYTTSVLFAMAIVLIGIARILMKYQFYNKIQEKKRSADKRNARSQKNDPTEVSKTQLALEGVFFFMQLLCACALCDQGFIKLLATHTHINSSILTYLTISFLSAGIVGAIGMVKRRSDDKNGSCKFSAFSKYVVAGGGIVGLLIGGASGYLIDMSGMMAHQDISMTLCGALLFSFVGAVISGECYAWKQNNEAVEKKNDDNSLDEVENDDDNESIDAQKNITAFRL